LFGDFFGEDVVLGDLISFVLGLFGVGAGLFFVMGDSMRFCSHRSILRSISLRLTLISFRLFIVWVILNKANILIVVDGKG